MRSALTLLMFLVFSQSAFAFHPRILFDQGHGQAFVIEQQGDLHLSGLAEELVAQGYEVASTAHPLTAELLATTDALIISGAFRPFSAVEIQHIQKFLENGGRLSVMVHIGPPVLTLLQNLGVDIANGVIREKTRVLDNEPLNFSTSRLGAHPLTEHLDQFSLYGSWPLRPLTSSGQTLAFTSRESWVDLSGDKRLTPGDAIQSFGVVVSNRIGKGEVLVFGDDAIFQNRFLKGDNKQLARNLGHWLAAGKARGEMI